MYKYNLYYPAGNTTALVIGINNLDFKSINNEILSKHKDVEQVGFVQDYELKMAGGEICFNALRCAGKYFLDTNNLKTTKIKLNDKDYLCGISSSDFIKDNNIKKLYKVDNFYYLRFKNEYKLNKLDDDIYYVDLGDIFHIIYTKKLNLSKINLKEFAYSYLKDNDFLDKKASGFMYLQGDCLEPIVWVRDIKTLFYESACGSGSFASYLYCNEILGKNYLALKQPSNEYLFLREVDGFIEISSIIKDITNL